MGRKSFIVGNCRICGNKAKLTYEHMPPKGAFNNNKHFYVTTFDKILEKNKSADFKGLTEIDLKQANKKQGGIGFYTLCKTCNNATGRWYGDEYIKWIYIAAWILKNSNNNPIQEYQIKIYPLRIIKQIISMFFSLNHDRFHEEFPSLKNFILHKENSTLDQAIRVFAYYNVLGAHRYCGHVVSGDLKTGQIVHMSEITFPPIGLVMTINSESPDRRLTEITHFSKFRYDDFVQYTQNFKVLPTHLPMYPGDYRTEEEIKNGLEKAKEFLGGQKD